jgi:small subunit ribosomal protein S1
MEFKVVKINETIKNAVVSHKALIESDIEAQRAPDHLQIGEGPGIGRYCEEHYRLWCFP